MTDARPTTQDAELIAEALAWREAGGALATAQNLIHRLASALEARHPPVSDPDAQSDEAAFPPVERIETVDYSTGFKRAGEPLWRVSVGGYCTDFEHEAAANNFHAAIDCLAARRLAPSVQAPRSVVPPAEALSFVREAVEFAYTAGLHEIGYDPVATIEAALASPLPNVPSREEIERARELTYAIGFQRGENGAAYQADLNAERDAWGAILHPRAPR